MWSASLLCLRSCFCCRHFQVCSSFSFSLCHPIYIYSYFIIILDSLIWYHFFSVVRHLFLKCRGFYFCFFSFIKFIFLAAFLHPLNYMLSFSISTFPLIYELLTCNLRNCLFYSYIFLSSAWIAFRCKLSDFSGFYVAHFFYFIFLFILRLLNLFITSNVRRF